MFRVDTYPPTSHHGPRASRDFANLTSNCQRLHFLGLLLNTQKAGVGGEGEDLIFLNPILLLES